jgi:hypothetical protein
MTKYDHGEAFAIMNYESEGEVPKRTERIWNSRDGVTPFYIEAEDGTRMRHVNFRSDVCNPHYAHEGLKVGDRVFVTTTPERAREWAEKRVDRVAESMPEFKPESEEERQQLINDMVDGLADSPDIVVVDQELLDKLRAETSPR